MQINLPPEVISLPALCNTALSWHTAQAQALEVLAHPPLSSLRDIRLPAAPRGDRRSVICTWLEGSGINRAELKIVIVEALRVAGVMELSLLFVLGPNALAQLN